MNFSEMYKRINQNALFQLITIRFREFIREPGIIFWSIIFPILMAWVLGVAFSRRGELVQNIALVGDYQKNEKLSAFLEPGIEKDPKTGSTYFSKELLSEELGKTRFKFIEAEWDSAILLMKRGKINLIVKANDDRINYHFDPQNPEAKLNYILISSSINHFDKLYDVAYVEPMTTVGTRYIDFLIPGLMAMGIMNSIIWGISYALIDMRIKKLMRRMVATPMKKSEFLISHLVARLALSIVEAAILFFFAKAFFDIKISGSIPAFAMMFLSGNIVFTGIAILISSRVNNSRVGTGLINVILLPMTILSGIFFSYHNFPDFAISIIKQLPLTMLADGIRSIFIERAGIQDIIVKFSILTIEGIVCFIIGLRIYKWY